MKKIIKLKKGFTMIELLGAIVIIGILATIGIVSVTKVLNSSHDKFNQSQGKILTQAGQNYFSDNKRNLPTVVGEKKTILLTDLVNNNYIDKIYGYDKKPFNLNSSFVTVTKLSNGKYKYEYNLCYDEAGTNCVNKTTKPNQTSNNSNIQFAYKYYTNQENNILYTNNQVLTTVTITKGSKDITGYKYEIIKSSNNKQVKTSEIINFGTTGQAQKDISLTQKDYKDGQYKIRVTSYDTEGAAKSVTSDKIIYLDTVAPTCSVNLSGTLGINNWYKEKNVSVSMTYSDNAKGSGINKDYGLSPSGLSYNQKISGTQTDTTGVTWSCYVRDRAGNTNTSSKNFKVDTIKPICSISKSGTLGSNSWYISNTTLALSSSDSNGIESKNLSSDDKGSNTGSYNNLSTGIQTEIKSATWYGNVQDVAGNIGNCNTSLKVDTTNPSCSVSTNGYTENTWTNGNVTLTGTCSDTTSGCTRSTISKNQTTNINSTISPGIVSDNSGRSTTCSSKSVKIDKTPPTCPTAGYISGSGAWTDQNMTIKGDCNDTGGSGCVGTVEKTITASTNSMVSAGYAYDNAGNKSANVCPAVIVKIDKEAISAPTVNLYKESVENGSSTSYGLGNNTWYSGYAYTTAGGSTSYSGNLKYFYTATGETTNNIGAEGSSRHINAQGTSYIYYYACNNFRCSSATPTYTIKLDRTGPSCTDISLKRGNGTAISANTWYSINSAKLSANCSDSVSGCTTTSGSDSTTDTGKKTLSISFTDNAGNSGSCSRTVWIDRTPPHVDEWKKDSNSACGDTTFSYVIKPVIKDGQSGYEKGYFDWKGGKHWPTGSRGGASSFTECIGSSTSYSDQSIKYQLCDAVDNCTTVATKSNF